jgi:hypothetical protein
LSIQNRLIIALFNDRSIKSNKPSQQKQGKVAFFLQSRAPVPCTRQPPVNTTTSVKEIISSASIKRVLGCKSDGDANLEKVTGDDLDGHLVPTK